MARQLQHLIEQPRPCSYLPDRKATLEHRVLVQVSAEETEHLLERGWRRFGPDYFRPRCAPCHECIPTRIPTDRFAPSKSQRRAREKCKDLIKMVGAPLCDKQRLDLYHRWHATREAARGWEEARLDARAYKLQFAMSHPAAREIAYFDPADHRLVGVALCDQTERAWSAIYFFYDPDWASRSIGTANVVYQVELARTLGIPHVYLGFRVADCPSLQYKASFRPQERLVGWPELSEKPVWTDVIEAPPPTGATSSGT